MLHKRTRQPLPEKYLQQYWQFKYDRSCYTQRSVLCVRHLKEVSMLTAFNWLERGFLEPNNLDGASLLNVLKRYKNSDQQYGRLVQFHKNRFHFLMRVAVGYSSRLLETKPFMLSMAF